MQRGFSLVELSIVLVILGLLTGGILAGQSLIRGAELRRTITNLDRYKAALHSFRDKYFAIPGDMANAKSFWPTCTEAVGQSRCNGNGNGIIDYFVISGSNMFEWARAFEHLRRAGLVEGNYDGDTDNFFPRDPLVGSVYINFGEAGWFPDNRSGHIIAMIPSDAAPVKTEDIWNMDTKLDDGNGYRGNFRIMIEELPDPGCINTTTGEYRMQETSNYCTMWSFW